MRPGPVLPQFAAAIAEAADRVGMQPPVIVGNSLGGMLALYMANDRREVGLSGIVPVATAGLHHPAWIRAISGRAARPVLPLLATAPLRRLATLGVARFGATQQSSDVAAHAPRYVSHLSRDRVRHQLSIVERLLDEAEYPLDVSRVSCPVLFVWGERDRAALYRRNAQRFHALAGRIAHADQTTLPRCGHTPQLEDPDALLRLIVDFVPVTPARGDPRWRGMTADR
jgi:pimeloyl-ACP methyl ester carboxylesterase